jgi:hypothetical protein
MRTFLLVYDRRANSLRELATFERRADAVAARVVREVLALAGGRDWEVVLLEATSVDVLERTHPSYFRGLSQLAADVERELVAA